MAINLSNTRRAGIHGLARGNSTIKKVIRRYRGKKGILIPMLQEIQDIYGYVPEESIKLISNEFSVYPVEIYGVMTFYAQFYLAPRGKYTIKVCQGTACHVMGGKRILDYISSKLGITEGETTPDGVFFLERVACLGCCGMAPVIVINDNFYARCTIQMIDGLLNKYRSKRTSR